MKLIHILLLVMLSSCLSCKKLGLCKDKELTLSKTEYSGQELRTDGFYYGRPVEDYQGVTFYELFVFYKNGILMLPGNIEFEKMEEYITMISRPGTIEAKYGWGLFNVEGGIISLEHWVAAQCGYPAVLRSGEILNDTTFVLKKRIIRDSQGTTETDVNEEFHFREFDVKPDSTNNFIK